VESEKKKDDYKVILSYILKGLSYWPILLVCLSFAFGLAFYKIRYNIPVYSVNSRILVKDEYSSWGQEYFLSGMELVSSRNRLVNEIGVIKSFPMMRKVMDQMPDLKVSYFDIGNIKTTEMYKGSPFSVKCLDSLNEHNLYNKSFYLKIHSIGKFYISSDKEKISEDIVRSSGVPFYLNKTKIVVRLNSSANDNDYSDKLFSFRVNNLDELAVKYQHAVSIKPEEKESSILQMSCQGAEIEKEIDFLNNLMNVYINHGLEQNNEIASNTLKFVDSQISEILDSLLLAESGLQGFKSEINNQKIDLDNKGNFFSGISELEKKRISLQFKINYFKYLIDYLKSNDDSKGIVVPTVIDMSSGDVLFLSINKIMDLYTKRNLMGLEVTSQNISFQNISTEIKMVKGVINENILSRLKNVEFELKQVDEQIAAMENKLYKIPFAERTYYTIQRNYKLNNDLYNYLLQKKSEANIAKASSVPKAQVVDWASYFRVQNISASSSSIYTKHIGISFFVGAGIIFLLIFFNDKIYDRKDIEQHTTIPILGAIGHNEHNTNLVTVQKPKSIIAEAFRGVRSNLNFMTKGNQNIVLSISSSVSGEGKTFCSVNLASVFAFSNKKTLIIGADLRKPRIFDDFGLKNDLGLSSYLINQASLNQIIQQTNVQNIDLIASGPIPPNPSELLESPIMFDLFDQLKNIYDVIIIDTAPIGLVTDALVLSNFADVNLYVIRENYSKKAHLNLINEYHETGKIKNVGIIVNDIKAKSGRYGYAYAYGYGYGYGYYDEETKNIRK